LTKAIVDTVYLSGCALMLWRAAVTVPPETWVEDLGLSVAIAAWPVGLALTALIARLVALRQAGAWPLIAFMPFLLIERMQQRRGH